MVEIKIDRAMIHTSDVCFVLIWYYIGRGLSMRIKSVANGKNLGADSIDCHWQEFVFKRIDSISEESLHEIEILLGQIDKNLAGAIKEHILERDIKISYTCYNQGIIDGMKIS